MRTERLNGALTCKLTLSINAGCADTVREWSSSCKLGLFTEIDRIREFELIVYARAQILLGRVQDAELLCLDESSPMAHMLRAYVKSRRKQPGDQLLSDRKAFAASLLTQATNECVIRLTNLDGMLEKRCGAANVVGSGAATNGPAS